MNQYEYEYTTLRIEKFFFITSFIIRKLNEANKISDDLLSKDYRCFKYKRKKDDYNIDFMNCHKIDNFYKLNKQISHSLRLKDLCNLFIHSYAFIVQVDNSKPCGVYVNTDRIKEKHLLHIRLNTYESLIRDVIKDNIVYMRFNRRTGELVKKAKVPTSKKQ
ncbi:hypothetical protein KAX97_12915 [candidate division WOR-3 bacterium]|nr:hypothetical protein [candidate division WOR-3 bacterium]